MLFSDDLLCGKCRKSLTRIDTDLEVLDFRIHALYRYDETMSAWMFRIKEAKDFTLAPAFLGADIHRFRRRFKGKRLVMVPSSEAKTAERGFHALRAMFAPLNLDFLDPFVKDEVKQSRSKARDRSGISRHIQLKDPSSLRGPLVLIDDVCTTGNSLKTCRDHLLPYCPTLEIFTIAVHPSWITRK